MRRRDFIGLMVAAAATAATRVSLAQEDKSMRKEESTAVYRADSSGLPQITRIIDTTSGPVRGLINDGVHTFKGIRYGAPPVGPIRWMPPQRPTPSKVVLTAPTTERPRCRWRRARPRLRPAITAC